jgi:amidase
MARSTHDVAIATEAMLDYDARSQLPAGGYLSYRTTSFADLKLGFVDPSEWRFPPDLWVPSDDAKSQHDSAYMAAMEKMKDLGAKVAYPVSMKKPDDLSIGNEWPLATIQSFEIEEAAKELFSQYVVSESEIQSLADMVKYNEDHPETCLPKNAPDQSWLVKAVKEPPSQEEFDRAMSHVRKIAKEEGFDRVMDENHVDIIIAPMDSPICSLSAASGYPLANVPLGRYFLKGQLSRPFGLAAIAKAGQEGTLIKFMSAYEANFPARPLPEQVGLKKRRDLMLDDETS